MALAKVEELRYIESSIFKAKNPRGWNLIIGMSIIITSQLLSLFMTRTDPDDPLAIVLFWTQVVLAGFCFVLVIITITRMLMKPFTTQISSELLTVRSKELKPSEIKEIRVQGYFSPLIGIIPVGKRITPVSFCFRFIEQEDAAIIALTEWARIHNIKVVTHKRVVRWL
ncbi:hypothetical protein SAMN05661091_3573 [Paenibacillus uliginis N3/975]|uniref:Uncharacterized protein n=1 Tax=Paenibacillus uliginis N3/975 TaxID=1313296 RepID=A0A1X7HI34_9BACL|nr:hypothetical protein [Paenibacillus uliginis]SMF86961.1 hypothetical protein SAMN05661091_3573 [Paenibacillus uliginis N3/975]